MYAHQIPRDVKNRRSVSTSPTSVTTRLGAHVVRLGSACIEPRLAFAGPAPRTSSSTSSAHQFACAVRTEAVSPDSSRCSWAYWRMVSSSRYRVSAGRFRLYQGAGDQAGEQIEDVGPIHAVARATASAAPSENPPANTLKRSSSLRSGSSSSSYDQSIAARSV